MSRMGRPIGKKDSAPRRRRRIRPMTAEGLAEEVSKHGIHAHNMATLRGAQWILVEPDAAYNKRRSTKRRYCGTDRCYFLRIKGHRKECCSDWNEPGHIDHDS